MQYSRAGLVVLVFSLIISFVSAVPIPATESGLLSSRSVTLNGDDITASLRIPEHSLSGRKSTHFAATTGRTNTRGQRISTNVDMDDHLERRNIFSKIKGAFQSLGHKIKSGFQKAGSAIKKGFQKAGSAIKQGFQKAGSAIKKGFQKVGKGIVTAAKKVGHFIKTTGAQVAKFGLKVVESVGEVAGKIAGFIPGVGKPLQYAIHGISKGAGILSDKIHAKLSPKLEKGMKIMDKADTIMGYIPRRRDLSEEEVFERRSISKAY